MAGVVVACAQEIQETRANQLGFQKKELLIADVAFPKDFEKICGTSNRSLGDCMLAEK